MSRPTIRAAREDDLADIQALLFEIFQEPEFNTPENGYNLWERMFARYMADPEKNKKDFWGSDRSRRYAVVLHENINGQLIGVAWILAKDGNRRTGELNKLYLRKDFRGQGLGQLLLKIMIDQAKKIGFDLMYLITGRELKQAITLYKKFGFVEVPQTRYQNSPNSVAMERALV